jgi:DNA-binding response OmpR family regulator
MKDHGLEKTILILEDEKDVAHLYEKYLRLHGYNPVVAFNGVEGLAKLKEIRPDLILLDLAMPLMNGIEFYRHICNEKGDALYRVLVLTARDDMMETVKSLHSGGVLMKPFQPAFLLKEIENRVKSSNPPPTA